MGDGGNRKSSISKKISAQFIDDEIDFDDLNLEEDNEPLVPSTNQVQEPIEREELLPSRSLSNGGPRRESRGISQEKVIPEENEEDDEEASDGDAGENVPVSVDTNNSPYTSAIEGYKSFAKSKLNGSDSGLTHSDRDDSDRSSSLSYSASTSSMSPAPVSAPPPPPQTSRPSPPSPPKPEDGWEEKIETFVQPARRVSTEISDKMRQKLANFEDSRSGKEQTPVRMIESDNSFKDKLKAFKSIESSVSDAGQVLSGSSGNKPIRRESEPSLQGIKPKGMPSYRSTSSSFMNTFQNNKFFQQNSLGSDKEDDSLSSGNHQLLDDALEESFNDILEDNKVEGVVFSADDFMPLTGAPQEKPPPLPSVPPPPPPSDILDQQNPSQIENEIDKQEREIIESLEREEKEHKKYLASSPSGLESSSVVNTRSSKSQSDLHSSSSTTSTTSSTGTQSGTSGPGGYRSESLTQLSNARDQVKKKPSEASSKDYNKHWLIQEAEQRRISEAKQKQNPGAGAGLNVEKIENINNNNGHEYHNYPDKRVQNNVSDNIYANVDTSNITFSKSASGPHNINTQEQNIPQIPGPQVPPRLLERQQDKVLSVSGKKKCSHCKEELGRGAAMIIESLKLFYHIRCFKCCVCSIQLGNGETGTDVRVRNNRLHCQNCYSNGEGLKFSKV